MNGVQPWERRDDESPAAFRAFCAYRDLPAGERSLSRAISDLTGAGDKAATIRRRHGQIERWSAQHDWQTRCAAWDGLVDEHRQQALLAAAVEAAERQATQARAFMSALTVPTRILLERIRDPKQAAEVRVELAALPIAQLLQVVAQTARAYPAIASEERVALAWQDVATAAQAEAAPKLRRTVELDAAGADTRPLWERFPETYWQTPTENIGAVLSALETAGYGPPLEYIRRQAEQFGWLDPTEGEAPDGGPDDA